MAIIRNTKFHLWIQQNDKLIEHLRLDYEKATGQPIEFDTYVERFFYQSKAQNTPLPSKSELKYMCWLADNRTLLNKGSLTMLEGEKDERALMRFHFQMYQKTDLGALPLSHFIT